MNTPLKLFSPEHRRIIGKLTRSPDGVMKEEIFLMERSLSRSLSYDPQGRNLYVTEVFGGSTEHSLTKRSVGGSRNQRDKGTTITAELLWSSIMVGAWTVYLSSGWCESSLQHQSLGYLQWSGILRMVMELLL